MCNLYTPASSHVLARQFALAAQDYLVRQVGPRQQGPFIRLDYAGDRELVFGRWGLIPRFAKEPDIKISTNNARSEEIEGKPSFRGPWADGQRCIIPAEVVWEPCWETGKNVWWAFKRADGDAFALAGLWNSWVDRETGDIHESYTMLTINADQHPIMSRMHKPVPALPADKQDKRMVVVLERDAWDTWLTAPPAAAKELMGMAPAAIFSAQPDPQKLAR